MANLSLSDLVFSEQANHNFSRILGDLKRSNLSIKNRLRSVCEDADFVLEVRESLGWRPLVANERCGSWYVRPRLKAASAYFKSTDGHAGQWGFSTRRLNLHLLPLIREHDGCIIVDSTRRGKRMPDALSKTVPVWCCVLNRALFPELTSQHDLYFPARAVSASEHSQMLARVPGFVDSFRRLGLDLPSLQAQLGKPLRPMWVGQPETGGGIGAAFPVKFGDGGGDDNDYSDNDIGEEDDDGRKEGEEPRTIFESFHPVICCTSSRRVVGTEMSESGYIQGAGDDTENWAHGLTAPIFWANSDRLLSAPEADLPDLIRSLVGEADEASHAGGAAIPPRRLTSFLSVAALPIGDELVAPERGRVVVLILPEATKPESWRKSSALMEVGLGKGKIASRNLRQALTSICSFVQGSAEGTTAADGIDDHVTRAPRRVLIACETGRDLSIGVALALACRCFDSDGNVSTSQHHRSITKDAIRVKLGRIVTAMPEANPSRATLQSVNSFLMDWRS